MLAAAILVVCGQAARGQNNCQELRAIMPWHLSFTATTPSIFSWNGPTFISLGSEELLITDYVLPPGPPPDQSHHGHVGIDRGVTGKWDFGSKGTVTFEQQSVAVYQIPPGKVVFGNYRTTYRITGGTGRFAQVTGNFAENGPYAVWFESPSDLLPQGRYSGELSGKICGVLPN
jgi:hypothetical protein